MAVTYPYLWGSARVTMEELETKTTIRNSHPEFWRRLKPMLELGEGRMGVGTCWRSSEVQRNTFLSRHYVVSGGGCCSYEGRRYMLRKGNAHAAPPGKSFHESTFHGYAQACDAVGDLKWMHSVEASYGLKDFRNVGSEPWHIQMTEISNSVTGWKAAGSPQPSVWKLPGGSTPSPTPTPPPSSSLEGERMLIMKYGGTPTGGWAGWYSFDGGVTRKAVTSMAHAKTLVDLGALDAKTRQRVTDPEWDGVSHTTSATTLDQYLTPYG